MVTRNEIRELIIPQLKLHLSKKDYDKIDYMFGEVYLIEEDGQSIFCLKPIPAGDGGENISLMFYALNGAYRDMGDWSYIKRIGKLM